MNIKTAAHFTRMRIDATKVPQDNDEYGKSHLHYMVDQIVHGKVTGEKAHRWLGFLQGVIVANGGATLEQVKQINVEA